MRTSRIAIEVKTIEPYAKATVKGNPSQTTAAYDGDGSDFDGDGSD
ncbi:hypothetical protein IQ249_03315 [Lusitaniella coriacea LEGE 07157]|uniref:Uncharacterized protein n=1 Tax=Lusitaniella coriacea LEGE 07157 TaxID=945747 RepID=A0A8J7DUX0_9CYAN|nr:hypothetical protein [Lusitaniella coriacea]MBE9114920.1 hypothetical protein [Lusitaniella coriacea LEGE 07157]